VSVARITDTTRQPWCHRRIIWTSSVRSKNLRCQWEMWMISRQLKKPQDVAYLILVSSNYQKFGSSLVTRIPRNTRKLE